MIDRLETRARGDDEAGGRAQLLVGLLLQQRGKQIQAIEAFTAAENRLPSDAVCSSLLGQALLRSGQTEAAKQAFARAIDRKPSRQDAVLIFTQLGRLHHRSGENDQATEVWSQMQAMYPGDLRVGERIAGVLAEEGQYESALRRYESLAEASQSSGDHQSIGFRIQAAEIKRVLGNENEALDDFEQLLVRLRPGSWLHSEVRRRIESGFLRSGDQAGLADYYAKQLAKDPDNLDTRMRLGRSLASADRIVEAIDVLTKAHESAPQDEDVLLMLVDVLQRAGRLGQAADYLELLAERFPDNPDHFVRWGQVLLSDPTIELKQREQAAVDVWMKLTESRRDDPVTQSQVADLLRRLDRREAVIQQYQLAIDLDPGQPQYREYLGEYLFQLGRVDQAVATWRQIAGGDRKSRDSLLRLGEVFETFKMHEEAIDSFAAAMQWDPMFAHRMRYAELLKVAERYDQALDQLTSALQDAESPSEVEQVHRAQIDVYLASGQLDQRIKALHTQVQASDSADVTQCIQLALMLEAAGRINEAVSVVLTSQRKHASELSLWVIAADLFRR
ncbi:MAG: tetratricopeptide repeat protein, partial [Planctomycetota bacterium]